MASVEPGASAATWRSVAAIASLVRYMLTPVEATTAGRPASKPAAASRSHHASPASKSTGTSRRNDGNAEAELDQALALPRLRTGLIDLEHEQTGGELRPALGEGVQARSEDDVLADAVGGLFHDQILDEAGAGHDGGAEGPRELRVHVRTAAPSVVRSRQLEGRSSSSSTCGGESTSTCSARHKATRTAVLSGAAVCLSCTSILPLDQMSEARLFIVIAAPDARRPFRAPGTLVRHGCTPHQNPHPALSHNKCGRRGTCRPARAT